MKEQHKHFEEVMEHISKTCHDQWDNEEKCYVCEGCPYWNLCDYFNTCPNGIKVEYLTNTSYLTES